jgi:hypothetical protein
MTEAGTLLKVALLDVVLPRAEKIVYVAPESSGKMLIRTAEKMTKECFGKQWREGNAVGWG